MNSEHACRRVSCGLLALCQHPVHVYVVMNGFLAEILKGLKMNVSTDGTRKICALIAGGLSLISRIYII